MAISKRLRYEILRRDNHACRYCGSAAPEVKLRIDHVIPVALGGSDEPRNLVTSCEPCNSGKTSTAPDQSIVDDVTEDAMRWASAMSQVAEMRRQQGQAIAEINGWFNAVWCNWKDWRGEPFPAYFGNSIVEFLNAGLVEEELEELVNVAMRAKHVRGDDKWKYFCGCCWKEVRRIQELAAQLVHSEEARV